MSSDLMEDPILNSPYNEPSRHFGADERGLTQEVVESRRPSSFYIPVPKAKTKQKQLDLHLAEGAFGSELQKENEFINKVRAKIKEWRAIGYSGITKASRDLLMYWKDESRDNKLFYCQIEALETLMYINEVAEKSGDSWIINELKKANADANPGLYRLAFKMATGSGKTVVMAMIIAYHTLNKIRYPQDTRFTDAFVIVTPGITIRDRLNVLHPNDPQNYYRLRNIVSYQDLELLQQATVHITNFHQLEQRQNQRFQVGGVLKAAKLLKEEAMKETPSAMVNRAFKSVLSKSRVLVINDEAHHCYREKPSEQKLSGEERKEADENNKAARVWISGLEALAQKININAVIDLSATPYFLSGSGYAEGTLFPWTTFDFSLLDALECGVVKIPRLPIESDTISIDDEPEFRNLWLHVRDNLPKKGLKTGNYDLSVLILPTKLQEALESLYGNYEKYHREYEKQKKGNPAVMPPVMIVVCNNTTVSELLYRWIAGYERETASGQIKIEKGNLEIFRNEDGVRFFDRPSTLLIDSAQIESGEKISDEFKKIFTKEIADFHKEYHKRFPGREDPTDEELLREVMNTVGKPGKLGENIKCVVSVSMLTEGWDVNTVTHVLGVRAFSTQLLCEQVVGRALRRVDYSVDDSTGLLSPEYAEVYGVPFSFLKATGPTPPQPPKVIHRVRSLPEREDQYQITFPRVEGYRYELNETKLSAHFTEESKTIIENEPTEVTLGGLIGKEEKEMLEKIKERREGEVIIRLVQSLLKRYYTDADGSEKYWLTPKLMKITEEYVKHHVILKDRMVIGYLSVGAYFSGALTKIQQAIVTDNLESQKDRKVLPILAPYDTLGSTRYVDYLTTKEVRETVKSHINYVVADTQEWEQGVAKKLEQMPEVLAYVKNQNLGFTIPYEHQGAAHQYIPDFIAVLKLPDGSKLNLLIEVTGKKDDKKATKIKTARELWVPAVNNNGKFGVWAVIEIQDIHETQNLIRAGMARGFDHIVPDSLFTK
ncbi:MAG: DEAD/DEAH box helicase family protein [Candidatus Peribacteraceae bacterium]|nr:DEAD/DEAH box helicase family protein [Candidatus Peribacteraceae bacterium]